MLPKVVLTAGCALGLVYRLRGRMHGWLGGVVPQQRQDPLHESYALLVKRRVPRTRPLQLRALTQELANLFLSGSTITSIHCCQYEVNKQLNIDPSKIPSIHTGKHCYEEHNDETFSFTKDLVSLETES